MTLFQGRGAAALAAVFTLLGCAGQRPAPASAPAPVVQPARAAMPDAEALRASLRTREDSLILDLVAGFRELAERTEGGADAEILRRARSAQNQLEYMLRRDGVKERGVEGRVVTAPGGEKITLRTTLDQLSESLLHNVPGTPWRPADERAREIQRLRPELSSLVEDADWVLSLSAALAGALPADDKIRLRRLHESYAARAPHAEITAQANALLADMADERMRREIKKLANRSWERERRGPAEIPAAPAKTRPAPAPPAPPPRPDSGTPVPAADSGAPAANREDAGTDVKTDAGDSLVTPDRYCSERRAEAARAFAEARGASDAAARAGFLRQSLNLLDDCLNRHPDSPEAEKARQNRARVEQELKP